MTVPTAPPSRQLPSPTREHPLWFEADEHVWLHHVVLNIREGRNTKSPWIDRSTGIVHHTPRRVVVIEGVDESDHPRSAVLLYPSPCSNALFSSMLTLVAPDFDPTQQDAGEALLAACVLSPDTLSGEELIGRWRIQVRVVATKHMAPDGRPHTYVGFTFTAWELP